MATISDRLKKVTDKFFTKTVEYHKKLENLGRFSNSETTIGYEIFTLKGIIGWENKSEKGQVDLGVIGKVDLSEGYIEFHFQDVKNVGLIDANDILQMNPNRDFLVVQGERLELLSADFVGYDWVTTNTVLVKCMFRREIKN
jgi:hypothetical protein